ncbi:hypothetical protein LR48_Vigan10g281000 [Vigna angularis]|uniref:Uncharacterized protein n=1 Tax=Phaseolus angularis TaxID=3914 RepID=A0A0L9VPN1_PHAAN|nr:uncharacterized protein LOC108345002 isoform X2 [Vigna angularis]KAG2383816.1 uncharacterized protein HKW66_Vig0257530 [Vigna angularis]KOM56918.1 hypothetical protein LR48_Vigan10g281000 [Vigna angularis]
MKSQTQLSKLITLFGFCVPISSSSCSISRMNHIALTTTINYSKLKFASLRTLLKAKNLPLSLSPRAFVALSPLNVAANYLRNFRVSGSYICSGTLLGVSIISAPIIAHAMDAGDALVDDHELQDLAEEEENGQYLWRLARKFWLPIFFFITVLTNLDDSITIFCIKLTLFLLSTKPNPVSVYVFVEQLCQKCMRQEARFLKLKSLYASKVEVQDYKLLCLAAVEVRDQKFTLVGILGSWWTLPHLQFWEAFSFVRNRIESILVRTT